MDKDLRNRTEGKPKRNSPAARLAAMLLLILCILTACFVCTNLSGFAGAAAVLSAKLSMPQGGAEILNANLNALRALLSEPKSLTASDNITQPNQSGVKENTGSSSSAPTGSKPVQTVQFGSQNGGGYETSGNVCVKNDTAGSKADVKNQLAVKPDIKISLRQTPQVLIVHTHTTESFTAAETGYYDPSASGRSTDNTANVVRVGDEVAKYLDQNGIGVYHDTTCNDYPEFDGAYGRSLSRIQSDLKKYPAIKVILDINRGSIQYSDGTRVKPTAVISGKKAAQIQLMVGDGISGSSLTVPDWQWNYRFALRIEQQLNTGYPGLARPIDLVDEQYNEQISHGALLVEFGTDVNTLDEAVYSGQLFGRSLATVLKGLQ